MMDDSKLLTTYVEAHDKWVAETNPTSVGDAWLAGARAVAGAAWDEALSAAGDQWADGDGGPIVNPYREGTP